ncbi:MAG: trypsin-like peptidase domain-containing protein [Candidatus Nanoarchaeia archaeon]|nr:trypsin-like peptidase domain-containing protein [Candidatus Nanoarchaeia archaeon]
MRKLTLLLLVLFLIGCQTQIVQNGVTEEFIEVANKVIPAVVSIDAGEATGSGFIINNEGHIITNYHVIRNRDDIRIYLADKRIFSAKVIGFDEETDVALIKIEGKDLPIIAFGDSNLLMVGQKVAAVGSPFGLESTITTGIISAKHRTRGRTIYRDFIQTDANVNPGNSGGPLVNLNGEVIGMNTFILAQSEGLGFSIPSNLIKKIVESLLENGNITRGYLGVQATNLIQVNEEGNGKILSGALIKSVQKNAPADTAGILPGDVIKKVGNLEIENANQLQNEVAWLEIGSTIQLTIDRPTEKEGFQEILLNLTIGTRPDFNEDNQEE